MRFPGGSPELYASRVSGLPPGYIYFLQCHVFWAVWAFLLLVELLYGALCGDCSEHKGRTGNVPMTGGFGRDKLTNS